QVEALRRLMGKTSFALLMAMRTGKTKVIIDDFGRLEAAGELEDLLVIAPAGVYRTWETALRDHASRDLLKRAKVYVWRSGQGTQKAADELRGFLLGGDSPRVLLVNVEALSTVEKARDLCLRFASQRRSMIVIDESTVIKNPSAKRTKFVVNRLAPL